MATTTIRLCPRPLDPPDEAVDQAVAGTQSLAEALSSLPWLPPVLTAVEVPDIPQEADDHQRTKRAG